MSTLAAVTHDESTWSELHHLARLLEYPTREVAAYFEIDLLQLENHYISLFVNRAGGVPAPPYAGYYQKNANRLDFMQRIVGRAHEGGIEIDMSQPPDYIPMMIEILCMARAQQDGIGVSVDEVLREFFHYWPEQFAKAVMAHDSIGMYAEVSDRIRELIATLVTHK